MAGKNNQSRNSLEERDRRIEERICLCLGLPRTNGSGVATHPSACAIPVASFVAVAEAVKRHLLADPGGDVPAYIDVIEEMVKSVVPQDEKKAAARRGILLELERGFAVLSRSATLVDFLRIATARGLSQTIWAQSRAFFRRQYISVADSEDLGTVVIHKLLRSLEGGKAPKGNFGAFVKTTRKHVLFDHFRKLGRTRARFAKASDAVERAEANDAHAQQAMLDLFTKELPPTQRNIIERRQLGETWSEVAGALGITAQEALEMAQRAWPGDLSSPRISRNRRCVSRKIAQRSLQDAKWAATAAYYQKKLDDERRSLESEEGSLPLYKNRHRRRSDA